MRPPAEALFEAAHESRDPTASLVGICRGDGSMLLRMLGLRMG